ncbi:hypothetical protein Bbelb_105050 [Branchiostoma belcheri]|nr:hypothetical protein Bbelb_105050 [Branchiostoma belcheri]
MAESRKKGGPQARRTPCRVLPETVISANLREKKLLSYKHAFQSVLWRHETFLKVSRPTDTVAVIRRVLRTARVGRYTTPIPPRLTAPTRTANILRALLVRRELWIQSADTMMYGTQDKPILIGLTKNTSQHSSLTTA